jgi:glycosyltransferase involved in cell wall biosynthesis
MQSRALPQQIDNANGVYLSVVSAVYNESGGIREFLDRLTAELSKLDFLYEVIIVDDGSTDATLGLLKEDLERVPNLKVVELRKNVGQIAALGAGMTITSGEWVLMLDGDLQHDPDDIPRLLAERGDGHDLIATYRTKRDESLRRKFVTKVANFTNRKLTGLDIKDFGSAYRLFDSGLLDFMRDGEGLVGYNTTTLYASARRVSQIPITQHRRPHGDSKWGLIQFISFNLDILAESPRVTHVLILVSVLGLLAGAALYLANIFGAFDQVKAISAPVSIALGSLQIGLLGVLWRELISVQRLIRRTPPFSIIAIWSKDDE